MKHIMTALALVAATASNAADFGTAEGKETGRKYITFQGPVLRGDVEKLKNFALLHPEHNWIAMSSPGGLANVGYQLGQTISELGLSVYVPYGGACVSACYIAFLGGKNYDIDGVLAAHNAYLKDGGMDETGGTPDINQTIVYGQQLGAYDAFYHLANGFNFTLPYMIAQHTDKDTFVAFTDQEDLNAFYARNDEDKIGDYLRADMVNVGPEWVEKHVVTAQELAQLAIDSYANKFPDALDPRKE